MKNSVLLAMLESMGISILGTPIYEQAEVLVPNFQGTPVPNQFGSPVLKIVDETNPQRFREIALRRGVDAKKGTYDLAKFVAVRNAKGKTASGIEWSRKKGDVTVFAI